jgi:hypothetical protein
VSRVLDARSARVHSAHVLRFRAMSTSEIIAHLIERAIDEHRNLEHGHEGCVPSLEIQAAYEVLDERLPQRQRKRP